MNRINMRTVVNLSGVTYDSTDTDRIFAEDIETIKDAIDDAATGINTGQLEIGGTLVIDEYGDIQNGTGIKPAKDKSKRGSDCTGNDGGTNRVLGLANTKSTTAILVIKDRAVLHEDEDYTVAHNASTTSVTFLDKLADDSYIEVVRFS